MEKGFVKERSEQFVKGQLEQIISDSSNPDAMISLLFSSRSGSPYISTTVIQLGIPEKDIKDMVLGELMPLGLVKVYGEGKLQQFRIVDEVSTLIVPPLGFGPYDIIKREGLNQQQVIEAMKSVIDLVKFRYNKRFEFDLEQLRELRPESHKALESIRTDEKMFFHTNLGVPKEYEDFPSFVSKADPTKSDGYDWRFFNLSARFDSPERAFKVGFDNIYGPLILKREYQTNHGLTRMASGIEIGKKGENWNLELKNSRYRAAMEGSVAYQQAVGEAIPVIKERLEEVLK